MRATAAVEVSHSVHTVLHCASHCAASLADWVSMRGQSFPSLSMLGSELRLSYAWLESKFSCAKVASI